MIRFTALWSALFLSLALFAPAQAQEVTKLTETNIQDYYRDAIAIFKSSPEEYAEFLQRAMHDDFINSATVVVNMPGQGPVKQEVTKNKTDSIAAAQDDFNASRDATLDYKIRKIKISDDGKSAIVTDNATVLGLLVPSADGSNFKVDSRGPCEDELVLTEGVGIQTLRSKCDLEMMISPAGESN